MQDSPISIAICAFNALEYTKLLVDSIRRHSRYRHEILIYSDGSTDGTPEWLRDQKDLRWEHDPKNRGICTAMNWVARMATRPYLFFPNTDHVLSPGWDEALIRRLGPRRVVSLQCIEPGIVPVAPIFHARNCGGRWDEFDEMRFHAAVQEVSEDRETSGINYPFVLSRELWDEVGALDERFDPGPANDPDLFYRLWFVGAELVRAEDVLTYHFSGKSSRMADEASHERAEWHAVTDRNEKRFEDKWGERYQYANGGLPSPGPEARHRWEEMRSPTRIEMNSPMKVVLDARSVGSRAGGIGLYTANLARALARRKDGPRIHCLVSEPQKPWDSRVNLLPCGAMRGDPGQDRFLVAGELRKAEATIHHGPAFYVPAGLGVPSVVTIHDLAFLLHPEWYPQGFASHLRRVCAESADAAAAVLVGSECTRRDLAKHFESAASKVRCTPYGLPEESRCELDASMVQGVKNAYAAGRDFILSVGVQQRRKNAIGLVRAYALMRQKSELKHKLVLVGGSECEDPGLVPEIRSLGLTSDVLLTPALPQDIVSALYRSASLFAYPSLYEGFGFPPLEAMAHGVPVVCSDRGSLPEVVGDAAVRVDPDDVEAWSKALEETLEDTARRETLRKQGLKQVEQFSWDRTAEGTMAVYQECLRSTAVEVKTISTAAAVAASPAPGLRVAIDARMMSLLGTGTGRYTAEILKALWSKDRGAEYVVIGPEFADEVLAQTGRIVQHVVAGPETLLDPAWEQFSMSAHLLGCDVLFAPTGIVPLARSCKAVAVVHDLGIQDHPDFYPAALKAYLDRWLKNSCTSSDLLISVSEFTRDSLARHYQLPSERIRVVHHGRTVRKGSSGRAAATPSVLCLSSFEPNKNQAALIEAFGGLTWQGDLVLAGRRGRALDALKASAKDLDRVRFIVDPDDERVQELLEEAMLFVYPSLYEGFGLPIVEAMGEGLPVITSRRGACAEVAGDGALVVDDPTPEALRQAMTDLLADDSKRKELSSRARSRAATFDWERAGDETWAAIERCARLS